MMVQAIPAHQHMDLSVDLTNRAALRMFTYCTIHLGFACETMRHSPVGHLVELVYGQKGCLFEISM